jgi:hypothetical protein
MKKNRKIVSVACGILMIATVICIPFSVSIAKSEGHSRKAEEKFVTGRVLVKYNSEKSESRIRDFNSAFNAWDNGEIPNTGVHILQLPERANEEAFAAILKDQPDVEFTELDRLLPIEDLYPNDPGFGNEWHLSKISAPAAWSTSTGTGNIVVAICDTGVDATHPDLAAKIVPGWNFYDNNADTSDVNGHGTAVAGTVAATSNNQQGVASVAWGCMLMPLRVADANGYAAYSTMASAITYAADHGARVANLSFRATTSSAVSSAASYMQSRGGVVTVAAGNDGSFDAAADNPYILTVSASDPNDVLYSWSCTGNNTDVAAPGVVYTTAMGGGYTYGTGTSFSAPIVAGEAALILSTNPNLTGDQVEQRIIQNADDKGTPGWDASYGWGRVNIARALGTAPPPPPPGDTTPPSVSFTSPSAGSTVSGTVTVQASASDNVGVSSVSLSVDGATSGTDISSPYNFSWNTTSASNGSHTLTVIARDAAGNSSSSSIVVTVSNSAADTTAPTISITSPSNGSIIGGNANVSVYVNTLDNVRVVRVDLYVDGDLTAGSTSAPFTTKWNAKRVSSGAHTLQCKAYDAAGNVGTSSTVTVYR